VLARSHVPLAISAWCVTAVLISLPTVPLLVGIPFAAFGGLLPDIDHPGSTLGRKLPLASNIIRIFLGHRGFTHSLMALAGCIWGLYYLKANGLLTDTTITSLTGAGAAALLLGIVSHLMADGMTKSGVPLLWPWNRTFRSPIALTTGSVVETMVTVVLVSASLLFVGHHYNLLH
jgi:inner membrane protein